MFLFAASGIAATMDVKFQGETGADWRPVDDRNPGHFAERGNLPRVVDAPGDFLQRDDPCAT
jgi:hypothetical protein